jgi:two-component system, OmpR family, alkaline phosphatase synthesis response regulator PhoP
MKSKKILIVDDNDLNRKLFENLLGQIYSFESAKNGQEALDKTQREKFDLILMDIQMPQMDGITAMKKIRLNPSFDSPIIAVTAFAETHERTAFINEGFDEFILKPIRPREFLETIRSILLHKKKEEPEQTVDKPEVILDKNILKQLLKYNSEDAIKNVFEEFDKECSLIIQLLNSLPPNSSELLENIHSFKGNSGTLGAVRIYLASQKMEESLKNKSFETWEKQKETMLIEIEDFRKLLNEEIIFES